MAISKEIIQQEHSSIQLSVTVDAPEVRGQYDELVASYAKKVQIPGFRKGKVPKDILERKLGDSLKGEALGHIMEKAVQEILGAEDFPAEQRPLPYSTPALREEPAFDPDKELKFSVYYDIFPTIKVGEWKGIEVESPIADIGNEDMQRELEQIRERNAIVMDKEEAAGAEKSDVATVDYAELGEDGELLPGSERQDFVFTIGTGYNIYKFDDEVIGMKAGETKDIEKSFPEDYEYTDLAGQQKRIRISLKTLKSKKLPDLDDELAQDVSDKYTTIAELKADIKADLEKKAQMKIRELQENSLIEKLLENSAIDVPESMINLETESRLRAMARRFNTDVESLVKNLNASGKDIKALVDEWRPGVEKALKSRLIIDTLIKEKSIALTDEDLEKELKTIAEGSKADLGEVKKYYEQDTMKEYLQDSIKDRKVFDTLLAEVKIKKGKKRKYLDLMDNNG